MTTIGEIISSTDRLALMQAFDHDEAQAHDERTRYERQLRAETEALLQAQMSAAFAELPLQAARQPRTLPMYPGKASRQQRGASIELNPQYDPAKPYRTGGRYRRSYEYHQNPDALDPTDPAPDYTSIEQQALVAAESFAIYVSYAIQQLDFDPMLEIAQLKVWDHIIRGIEQVIAKLQDDYRDTRWKQKAHARNFDGSGPWNDRDLQLTHLLHGLTVQGKALAPLITPLALARDRAVSVSGINFGAYKSLKVIQQDRKKKAIERAQLEQWVNLSPREKYLRGRRLAGYEPRMDGIDADGSEDQYDN